MIKGLRRKIQAITPAFFLGKLVGLRRAEITPILLYHANYKNNLNPLVSGKIHNIHPDVFLKQLRFLEKHFRIVPLEEIFQNLHLSRSQANMAAITFDDGYSSCLNEAFSILEDLKLPFSIFVTTALVEKRSFWRDKIRWVINQGLVNEFLNYAGDQDPSYGAINFASFYNDTKEPSLISSKLVDDTLTSFLEGINATETVKNMGAGIYCTAAEIAAAESPYLTFGNHTANHYVLSSLSGEEQYNEIRNADLFLRSLGKAPSKFLSIPFGGKKHFNGDTLSIMTELGYEGYLLSENRINHIETDSHFDIASTPTALNRFMPGNDMKQYLLQMLR